MIINAFLPCTTTASVSPMVCWEIPLDRENCMKVCLATARLVWPLKVGRRRGHGVFRLACHVRVPSTVIFQNRKHVSNNWSNYLTTFRFISIFEKFTRNSIDNENLLPAVCAPLLVFHLIPKLLSSDDYTVRIHSFPRAQTHFVNKLKIIITGTLRSYTNDIQM